ncbi:MAG TPA: trypsin-like peptidase domain-containing protein [Solirubrobacterales bacterium]
MSCPAPARARRGARIAATALAVLAGAFAIAACGSDDDGDTASTTTTTTTSAGGREQVIVGSSNGSFDPQAIFDETAPGVVTVTSIFDGEDLGGIFGGGGGGQAAGQGTGFVVSGDGEVITNAHVVTDAQAAGQPQDLHPAKEVYVQFPDRNNVPAEIVGFDPFADVALLKVDPEGLDLQPLEFGDSDAMEVGEPVAAIGSPFGQRNSLSVGIVSADERSIESLTEFQIDGAIQTDASINPGNSGGPLLNADGEVIGVNQQINTRSGGNEGVGFAVPSKLVQQSLDGLREDGEPDYAYIGVSAQPLYPQLAEELGIEADTGSLLAEVVPGSPAADAGLEGGNDRIRFQGQRIDVGGDVIVAIDGEKLVDEADLPRLISSKQPGDEITLDVIHSDGDTEEIDVELEERPDAVDNG